MTLFSTVKSANTVSSESEVRSFEAPPPGSRSADKPVVLPVVARNPGPGLLLPLHYWLSQVSPCILTVSWDLFGMCTSPCVNSSHHLPRRRNLDCAAGLDHLVLHLHARSRPVQVPADRCLSVYIPQLDEKWHLAEVIHHFFRLWHWFLFLGHEGPMPHRSRGDFTPGPRPEPNRVASTYILLDNSTHTSRSSA